MMAGLALLVAMMQVAPTPALPARVVFYRTGGIRGVLRSCDIFEGKRQVAHLSPNSAVTVEATTGPHLYVLRGGTSGAMATAAPTTTTYVRCKMVGMVARPSLIISDVQDYLAAAASLKKELLVDVDHKGPLVGENIGQADN